jgi:hypothetical protein
MNLFGHLWWTGNRHHHIFLKDSRTRLQSDSSDSGECARSFQCASHAVFCDRRGLCQTVLLKPICDTSFDEGAVRCLDQ